MLVLLFAVHLNWLPAGGMSSARVTYYGFDHVLDVARHLVLPVTTLMLFEMAMITRFTRAAMIEALGKDYVTVAYAKGATHSRVLWRHALPNALVTSVTIIGLEFGVLLAGAVVTEIIYGLPGLGRLFFDSIFRRDFQLMTGCFIFASAAVVVVNIITDIIVGGSRSAGGTLMADHDACRRRETSRSRDMAPAACAARSSLNASTYVGYRSGGDPATCGLVRLVAHQRQPDGAERRDASSRPARPSDGHRRSRARRHGPCALWRPHFASRSACSAR